MATAGPVLHTYLGADERIYSSYLAVLGDGHMATLRGVPGADPVEIQRASGDENLPEIPADGLWTTTGPVPDDKPAKTQKATPSKAQDA